MTRSADILNELVLLSPLVAEISHVTPYKVPVDYFDLLEAIVMARIAAGGNEENSLLQVAGKQMPQDVPQGYFDSLPDSILSKIKTQNSTSVIEELNELSPLLATLPKANLYEVPAGYFEHLSAGIAEQTTSEAKVISVFSRRILVRFAAAAVVFTLIAFGINLIIQHPATGSAFVKASAIKTEEQFNQELARISDDEIISYLKLTADSKDAEIIASSIEESQLPATAEYMDHEFLETFMKELEKTEQKTN